MKPTFILHGLKRSGNHALVSWLTATAPFVFYNNIIPMEHVLKGTAEIPDAPVPFRSWLAKHGKLKFWGKITIRFKYVLTSLEDHEMTFRPFSKLPARSRNLLILRDPYNLFASRIRKASLVPSLAYGREPGPMFDRNIALWKAHAREFLGDTHHLANKTTIYYNAWFLSEAYRRKLCAELGLPFSDAGLTRVSKIGGGSSFDGTQFDQDARKMDVLNRTGHLNDKELELFKIVQADPEIADLHRRVEELVGMPE